MDKNKGMKDEEQMNINNKVSEKEVLREGGRAKNYREKV